MSSRIERFRKIVKQDPGSDIAHFGLGKAFLDNKEYTEAEASFRRVMEINPDYTAVYVLMGKVLEKLGRADDALKLYKEGITVGERTGDIMPKNEMEHRIMKLEWRSRKEPSTGQC